jgi:hypothetical protein
MWGVSFIIYEPFISLGEFCALLIRDPPVVRYTRRANGRGRTRESPNGQQQHRIVPDYVWAKQNTETARAGKAQSGPRYIEEKK